MNRFVLKNTFVKIYTYHFLIDIFYRNKESKLGFETVSLSSMTFFMDMKEYLKKTWLSLQSSTKFKMA